MNHHVEIRDLAESKKSSNLIGITAELALIDLGRIEINESKDCYFTLNNALDSDVSFYVEAVPVVQNLQSFGQLKSKETRRIDLSIKPKDLGYGDITLFLRSAHVQNGEIEIQFIYVCVQDRYLLIDGQFLSCTDPKLFQVDLLLMGFLFLMYQHLFGSRVNLHYLRFFGEMIENLMKMKTGSNF